MNPTVLCRKTVSTFTMPKIDNIIRLLLEGEKKVFVLCLHVCASDKAYLDNSPYGCNIVLTAYICMYILPCRTADSLTTLEFSVYVKARQLCPHKVGSTPAVASYSSIQSQD